MSVTTPTVYRLAGPLPPDSELVAELVRVWRAAREDRLRFLNDLHGPDEDRAYLSGTLLPNNEFWVVEVGGTVAGFIAFAGGWVNQLYVAPAFQGHGVGTQLLALAMRHSPALQLWVFEPNAPAIEFYERRGFRVVERTDGAANEAKRPDVRMQWGGGALTSVIGRLAATSGTNELGARRVNHLCVLPPFTAPVFGASPGGAAFFPSSLYVGNPIRDA